MRSIGSGASFAEGLNAVETDISVVAALLDTDDDPELSSEPYIRLSSNSGGEEAGKDSRRKMSRW